MVYSYSKRLLFEYVKNLPNNSDDVIQIETDGIYVDGRCKEKFISQSKHENLSCLCYGRQDQS
jgi:hypothetical protein